MKKVFMGFLVGVILFLTVSASVWEGAAVTARTGELPEHGYFVATQSFPRNTVVDVTNLETGISVRVIVVTGLNSPGLLAMLSKDAADALGIPSRGLARIRMTMPADPIAFSRFTEGRVSSGDPDYDPAAAVAATIAVPPEPSIPPGTPAPETERPPLAELPPAITQDHAPTEEAASVAVTELEPENAIVDLNAETYPAEDPVRIESIVAEPGELPALDSVEMSLVPAEARPPLPGPEPRLPESAEIPAIPAPTPAPLVLDEADFVPPIERAPVPVPTPPAPPPAAAAVPTPPAPPPTAAAVPTPPAPPPTAAAPAFSAPLVQNLERGRYYLQLGAFGKAQSVQSELKRVRSNVPLLVQKAGSTEKPIFRILVGPLNLGESAALLHRFRNSGYPDAFIRQGD